MKPRLLLIDGDVFAYRYAAAGQWTIDWGDGDEPSVAPDVNTAFSNMRADIEHLVVRLEACRLVVCLSDDAYSWRRERVWPAYKENRKGVARPVGLKDMKDRMRESFEVKEKPLLEADDVMGILQTNPMLYPEYEKVIVTRDKDMLTVPGLVAMIRSNDDIDLTYVFEESADYRHRVQTLSGDPVDGYPGCKKVGPVKAARIAASGWGAVAEAFSAAGHDETHFLAMARCARILRATDYDYKKKEPILWNPPTTTAGSPALSPSTPGPCNPESPR